MKKGGNLDLIYGFIIQRKSLFFSLMKRTKNQGWVIDFKAQIPDFFENFRFERFILFAPEMLILSVIFCEASAKSLAFQFTNKNKQSQGQMIYEN